ncbi:protein of unknown function [Algoriphagus faecimaris]|uniref:DUF4160 domain-containing protein n=1 Tax=Algoriphagus faecimaris TaxID=686796 RepID=A0A1G6SL57_9BACT|nr:DUF4160 domain-containing protein [Algoriphagus faecimaris]SDD17523.1 protein of unknown function [Algoriphagus faecimaris]
MPTILKINGYRFFFYSNDHLPKHILVEKSGKAAKFLLDPIELISTKNFSAPELREIRILIQENIKSLTKSWDEYFN